MQFERAVIEVNGACNYSCKMCPQTQGRAERFKRPMDRELFLSVLAQANPKVVNLEGSGEPTLNNDLPWYIETAKKHGAQVYIFSNGLKMRGQFMRDCVDAGLDFYRFSIIGYNAKTYKEWMGFDFFSRVCENMYDMRDYATNTKVASYHLILQNDRQQYELEQYLKIAQGGLTEVWKMHNWSGNYEPEVARNGKRRTCGRPFSNDLVVRANGVVHPCCQVLGNDDAAELGDLTKQTLGGVYFGEAYNQLRKAHLAKEFPSYCAECDFLIDDAEVLVYSNHAQDGRMHGTVFNLKETNYA